MKKIISTICLILLCGIMLALMTGCGATAAQTIETKSAATSAPIIPVHITPEPTPSTTLKSLNDPIAGDWIMYQAEVNGVAVGPEIIVDWGYTLTIDSDGYAVLITSDDTIYSVAEYTKSDGQFDWYDIGAMAIIYDTKNDVLALTNYSDIFYYAR